MVPEVREGGCQRPGAGGGRMAGVEWCQQPPPPKTSTRARTTDSWSVVLTPGIDLQYIHAIEWFGRPGGSAASRCHVLWRGVACCLWAALVSTPLPRCNTKRLEPRCWSGQRQMACALAGVSIYDFLCLRYGYRMAAVTPRGSRPGLVCLLTRLLWQGDSNGDV